jgi:hypothetical protein
MKWSWPKQYEEKSQDWHLWFAWYPIRIRHGDGTRGPMVWLEPVLRKVEEFGTGWGSVVMKWYRLPPEVPSEDEAAA